MSPLGQYYNLKEAARLVNRSTSTLKMRIQPGHLKAQKESKTWFIHLSELKEKYQEAFGAE